MTENESTRVHGFGGPDTFEPRTKASPLTLDVASTLFIESGHLVHRGFFVTQETKQDAMRQSDDVLMSSRAIRISGLTSSPVLDVGKHLIVDP